MQTRKPLKKSTAIEEKPAASISEPAVTESKPVKRTTKKSAAPAVSATTSTKPKKPTHRHSKASVPVTPRVVEESAPVIVQASEVPPVETSREEVARLAYSYWQERHDEAGSPEDDWLRAVKVLSAKA